MADEQSDTPLSTTNSEEIIEIDDDSDDAKEKICAVYDCAKSNLTIPGLTLFSVPRKVRKRTIWLDTIKAQKPLDSDITLFVCERHFDRNHLIQDKDGWRLKEDAVPSQFLPQSFMQKENICTQTKPFGQSTETQTGATFLDSWNNEQLNTSVSEARLKKVKEFEAQASVVENEIKQEVLEMIAKKYQLELKKRPKTSTDLIHCKKVPRKQTKD